MDKTTFIKETDKKGTDIIEGWIKPGKVFSIKRFVCIVQPQETEKETQKLADDIVSALKKAQKWDDLEEKISKFYEDENSEGDLIEIGEIAASSLGFL